jgi:hypothetical protein
MPAQARHIYTPYGTEAQVGFFAGQSKQTCRRSEVDMVASSPSSTVSCNLHCLLCSTYLVFRLASKLLEQRVPIEWLTHGGRRPKQVQSVWDVEQHKMQATRKHFGWSLMVTKAASNKSICLRISNNCYFQGTRPHPTGMR